MTAGLDKKDLISLIRGICPSYEQMSDFEKLGLGTYTGGFADKWDWNSKDSSCWDEFSEGELYGLYLTLKIGV